MIEGSAELDLVDAEALLDLNGDGYDDLVFGTLARPEATLQGQVHVFFGQPFDG
ncbi:FG-GAP repeat protein [Myxococcota bacterium]|nr:FG-GAP repeat protein [Myxococcota bacterium]